jgi:hypothetical protein
MPNLSEDRSQREKANLTEVEWQTCRDPQEMLKFLGTSGGLSQRKTQLYACAAVRRVEHLLADERSEKAVEAAERRGGREAVSKRGTSSLPPPSLPAAWVELRMGAAADLFGRIGRTGCVRVVGPFFLSRPLFP